MDGGLVDEFAHLFVWHLQGSVHDVRRPGITHVMHDVCVCSSVACASVV